MRSARAIAVITAALWLAAAPQAGAAVRICQAPVSSGLASDAVEARARAKALTAWVAKARLAGTPSPSWRIAGDKHLRCAKVGAGTFDCIAYARPCSISQVPRPSPPPRRGKAIDKPIAT